jgi:hypothetical protein
VREFEAGITSRRLADLIESMQFPDAAEPDRKPAVVLVKTHSRNDARALTRAEEDK